MAVKQISAFVENKPGKLYDIFKLLSDAEINIRAMSIADTKEFGVLRLIVSDTEKAKEVIGEDTVVITTDVVAVEMSDKAGALCDILKVLGSEGVNIEYTYAFTSTKEMEAYSVLRVNDAEAAEKVLAENGIRILTQAEIEAL